MREQVRRTTAGPGSGSLGILQVSTYDMGGGAEGVARLLHSGYRERGHRAWMVVGEKRGMDPDVLPLKNDELRPLWSRAAIGASQVFEPFRRTIPGAEQARRFVRFTIGQPRRQAAFRRGQEEVDFPATSGLLQMPAGPVDVVHAHNLHGGGLSDRGYFDLRTLPLLSHERPFFLTLHDAWLLTGHCSHSFECEKWRTGCGSCPDLSIYPAIPRDDTAGNWLRKKAIFERSRLYVATPSKWLMDKVDASILAPSIREARVIPNGVDQQVFKPSSKAAARESLQLPKDRQIVLFAAHGVRANPWKDFRMLEDALERVGRGTSGRPKLLIALGENGGRTRIGQVEIQFVPFVRDPQVVAAFYQAADVYVHAAKVDTFPTSVLEAMACGVPVVATSVGGIPEQVHEGVTGRLVQPGQSEEMAHALLELLRDDQLRSRYGKAAAEIATQKYDAAKQIDAYLAWYQEVIAQHAA